MPTVDVQLVGQSGKEPNEDRRQQLIVSDISLCSATMDNGCGCLPVASSLVFHPVNCPLGTLAHLAINPVTQYCISSMFQVLLLFDTAQCIPLPTSQHQHPGLPCHTGLLRQNGHLLDLVNWEGYNPKKQWWVPALHIIQWQISSSSIWTVLHTRPHGCFLKRWFQVPVVAHGEMSTVSLESAILPLSCPCVRSPSPDIDSCVWYGFHWLPCLFNWSS